MSVDAQTFPLQCRSHPHPFFSSSLLYFMRLSVLLIPQMHLILVAILAAAVSGSPLVPRWDTSKRSLPAFIASGSVSGVDNSSILSLNFSKYNYMVYVPRWVLCSLFNCVDRLMIRRVACQMNPYLLSATKKRVFWSRWFPLPTTAVFQLPFLSKDQWSLLYSLLLLLIQKLVRWL